MPNTEAKTEASYSNGPYIVLDDDSTYAGDGQLVWITDKGQQQLEESLDFKSVEGFEAAHLTIDDLLDAYNKVHGTNL
jgi:hypothetical protein|tara:strand:- start:303 stop:536 length:234 start_codon:yes stop_codon:yes gene_type:complete